MIDISGPIHRGFVPKLWILPPEGTNGHITSWGPLLAGLPVDRFR